MSSNYTRLFIVSSKFLRPGFVVSFDLLDLGFISSLVDYSLIYHNGDIKLSLILYVDDLIFTSTHVDVLTSFDSRIQLEFPLKDLGLSHLGPLELFIFSNSVK